MKNKIKNEISEYLCLLRSVPTVIFTLFVLSVFSMNLLANKSVSLPFQWMAIDCGTTLSWFAFLTMDVLTKRFGPKASTQISLTATALNLFMCGIFYLGSIIPGLWGESFVDGSADIINTALNNTFGGTWYVIVGSTIAFVISSFINNFSNHAIGKCFKKNPDGIVTYFFRSFFSTTLGQFADNFLFSTLVGRIFFGWSFYQIVGGALATSIAELILSLLFTVPGHKICKFFDKHNVGNEYLEYVKTK